ncbi:diguanylate cyclase [Maridesulfovibrio sp.]|uniref:GGDEF domain-containing protein n=1 Tax=Maridesulfovibrio sp. TaxID=2795000 RepID=UPI0029F517F2|nr:diguanylate cyclase [Maridesulfovibrio sp.]
MRTMLLVGAMVCLTLALIMTYYSFARKTYSGFQYWTSGIICIGTGAVLLSMRSFVPIIISVVLGNFLVIMMPFLLICGLESFLNIKWKLQKVNIAVIAIYLISFIWCVYLSPDLNARIIAVCSVMTFFFAQSLYISLKHIPSILGEQEWSFVYAIAACTISSALRVTLSAMEINNIKFINNTATIHSIIILFVILSVISSACSLLILNSYRLENDLKEAYTQIKKMANVDDLCKIYNRRFFNIKIAEEFSRSQRTKKPLSLLMIDVDCFKLYNDKYGHQAGDQCLTQIASILNDSVKRPSDITARYGGEEFVVLLPDTNSAGAKIVAENIQAKIKKLAIPHIESTVTGTVTLSIGIATVIPEKSITPEMLIKYADNSLYKGKQNGRNQIQTHV